MLFVVNLNSILGESAGAKRGMMGKRGAVESGFFLRLPASLRHVALTTLRKPGDQQSIVPYCYDRETRLPSSMGF